MRPSRHGWPIWRADKENSPRRTQRTRGRTRSISVLLCVLCVLCGKTTLSLSEGCTVKPHDPNRVLIFDTTLRDGEQSPGASMNLAEKLEIAHALEDLGVDIIEAGFPIASPGDFEAVQMIGREVHGPVIAGLARCNPADIDRAQ